ncbi:hypothetical protein P4H27_26080 [Paenibacillus taichungensis]|uniref:hypothetical protein n=1 Tax=Paenibacillus taichungensis TaxID=484184 RepID=UPI002DBEC4F2|nr:hypothetical protein [Paenibacillus taichungensis]MEC0110443.1 hypothetical protein [Paenibacillus taichungensis]MEC0200119.1 hypothetical protein [Paenibacillus taichungensis]
MKWVTNIYKYEITIEETADRVFTVDIDHYERSMHLWFVSLAAAKRYVKTEYGEKDTRIKWTKVAE